MQTIFRVQTPATINGRVKEQCYVFDFAPDRTLKVIAETAKISSKAGKTSGNDRKIMGEFLNFCPIISIEGSKMSQFDVPKMLEQLKRVYVERVVRNGFEDRSLYNDELMKLNDLELQEFDDLKKIIGQTKARTGDYVGPGSQYAVLNTVSQVDTIRVVFFIPEDTYFDLIRRGRADFSEIMLTISDNIAYPHRGHFDFIGRAVEQGTGSLNAQVSFPNPDTLLRPGQFARIRTVVDTLRSALLIPQQAVMRTQGISSVYALDSAGRAKQRIVSLGNTYNNMWVVNSGLDSGARVVTSGFHKVREGAVVEPMTVADSLQK